MPKAAATAVVGEPQWKAQRVPEARGEDGGPTTSRLLSLEVVGDKKFKLGRLTALIAGVHRVTRMTEGVAVIVMLITPRRPSKDAGGVVKGKKQLVNRAGDPTVVGATNTRSGTEDGKFAKVVVVSP